MELKVWVEGIQRIVCGVSDNTTCQDVVYALAHATGKTGRFTLVERWRNNERLLAPQEHPLKILTKWGEYSNDVQFILQWSAFDGTKQQPGGQQLPSRLKMADTLHSVTAASPQDAVSPSDRNKDIRKSLTFSGGHHIGRTGENVGVVKARPLLEVQSEDRTANDVTKPSRCQLSDEEPTPRGSPSHHGSSDGTASPYGYWGKREAPPYRDPPGPASPLQRTLPPYRHTPGPSPSQDVRPNTQSAPPISAGKMKTKRNLLKDFQQNDGDSHKEAVLFNAQYRDLVCLVNYQREKLSTQQAELTKFDAEIVFWEGKTREQHHQMEFLAQEAARIEVAARLGEEQLRLLGGVEEESEIVRQQEKTLKSELTLLRSKLANCETELLQCKNKIRLVLEELQLEQRSQVRESEDRQSLERSLLGEVERLQHEVEQAKQGTEMSVQCGESLKREVQSLEAAIADKKQQVERLVAEMKEANLESLAIAPADEVKHLLEGSTFCLGPHKPGSTRRMIGSPRQLENAVPTSKNPHGVWV
ncbi:ras association domain-containing protein 8 [Zootermopsis nevadensis]|uniref:ras association domain-containing protein 8 n=1 Tax=Zootermopsis nevadensis TaxID=136037 RepID=UPI000B8E883A|nr:ras association domain-containing protein 8 [Zootermopsis nevadensis]